jgi:phage baseplate assembly protein W
VRNLAVKNGDIVLGSNQQAVVVTGQDKLSQDLRLWLLEPIGTGFMTPSFGSVLMSLVGQADPDDQADDVRAEVERVLGNYQQNQVESIRQAAAEGRLNLYSRREVLNAINGISITVDGDTIVAVARIVTGADRSLSLPVSVAPDGVSV